MNRKDYEFAKKAARTAYQEAIRDGVGGGVPEEHEHPHEHDDLQAQVDHNEDRINALEHELEALADTKEAGEWEFVSLLDFDVRGQGQMLLTTDDFTQTNQSLSLHSTDTEGVSHGFSRVEVGDYVEIVEEHKTRGVGDYGLYVVKGKNGNDFDLELEQGQGTATYKSHFIVKFFHLNDNLDLTDLDARYALSGHSHSSVPSHTHNYASSTHTHSSVPSHTHNYASSSHTHSGMGLVKTRHGTKTYWDANQDHYGSDKVFIKYRPSTGSLYDATSSSKVSETGQVRFCGNTSGLANGYGERGLLIAHTHTDYTYSPYLMMEVFHTEDYTNYGQRNHSFRGITTWVRGDAVSKTWSQAPGLYWIWIGDPK